MSYFRLQKCDIIGLKKEEDYNIVISLEDILFFFFFVFLEIILPITVWNCLFSFHFVRKENYGGGKRGKEKKM